MHTPEGWSAGGRGRGEKGAKEEVADPKEANIDKTLLHYITPDARASPRSHNINACCISRSLLAVILRVFVFSDTRAARQNLPQISGKTFLASQMCVFAAQYLHTILGFSPRRFFFLFFLHANKSFGYAS